MVIPDTPSACRVCSSGVGMVQDERSITAVPYGEGSKPADEAGGKWTRGVCRRREDCLPWRPQLDKHNQTKTSRQSVGDLLIVVEQKEERWKRGRLACASTTLYQGDEN